MPTCKAAVVSRITSAVSADAGEEEPFSPNFREKEKSDAADERGERLPIS